MRKLCVILLGVATAMLTITLVELIGHYAYPVPAGANMRDPNIVAEYIATAPTGALAIVAVGWFLGAALGGWTALRIARWAPASWIIAALIAVGGIVNATQIPAPLWLQLATVLAPALGGFAAHLLPGWRRG